MSIEYSADGAESARKEQDNLQRYRNVFGSPEGIRVLGDILVTCHFGVPLNDDVERIEYNVGVTIARMSGMMSEIEKQLGIGGDRDGRTNSTVL
jgi:hypothetical protein